MNLIEQLDRAKDGYYGFSKDGGDTDNLVIDLEGILRGEHKKPITDQRETVICTKISWGEP